MCNLSSPSGDWTCNPCNARRRLNHWTTTEVLLNSTLDEPEQGSQSPWGRAGFSSDRSFLPIEQGCGSPQRLITSSYTHHRLHRLPRLHTSSSPPYPCKMCCRTFSSLYHCFLSFFPLLIITLLRNLFRFSFFLLIPLLQEIKWNQNLSFRGAPNSCNS